MLFYVNPIGWPCIFLGLPNPSLVRLIIVCIERFRPFLPLNNYCLNNFCRNVLMIDLWFLACIGGINLVLFVLSHINSILGKVSVACVNLVIFTMVVIFLAN